ncbi:TPM domain-containing protein [Marinicrinis sediminis]|uniref:TPM domain-containing protein n=1 Tax=Marinicrinis sediminis TaxID=1652465 RepID=A0ABW5RBK1_9BACL
MRGIRIHPVRILVLITILLMLLPSSVLMATEEVLDEKARLIDDANLFAQSDAKKLESEIVQLSERIQLDVVVVTTDDNAGKTSRAYADDLYDQGGYGFGPEYDGLLLLINMDDREIYISTSGQAIRYLTDARIDRLLDQLYTYMQDARYTEGVQAFVQQLASMVAAGVPSGQYEAPEQAETPLLYKLLLYAGISIVIGLIVVGIMASSNKGQMTTTPGTYLDAQSFRLIHQSDHHFDTDVKRVKIETQTGGGAGSTTHHSGGGRKHGGGGRKF